MGSESGILVLALVVGFLAIGSVCWNSVFGGVHDNLMPNNTSTYYGTMKQTDTTTGAIGSIWPWALAVGAALLFVAAILALVGGKAL